VSHAKSNTITEAYLGDNVSLPNGTSLTITATGTDKNTADTTAGSGGIAISGAGSEVRTETISSTLARVGAGSADRVIDVDGGDPGSVSIYRRAHLGIQRQGARGFHRRAARQRRERETRRDRHGERRSGRQCDDSREIAHHHGRQPHEKPELLGGDSNVLGATGGLVSGAGAASTTTMSLTTEIKVGLGAKLTVTGDETSLLSLFANNDFNLHDKVQLESGGVIAGSGTDGAAGDNGVAIRAETDIARITISDTAELSTSGVMRLAARGQGTIVAPLGGQCVRRESRWRRASEVTLKPTNEVLIGTGVKLTSDGNLNISTGTGTDFMRDEYTLTAQSDSLAGSAIPITDVEAVVTLTQTNNITINSGAVLETASNIYLHAERLGFANITANAKATSWFTKLATAVSGNVELNEGENRLGRQCDGDDQSAPCARASSVTRR
jgi:hypothetical protein